MLKLAAFIYRRSSAPTKWLVAMQLVLICIPPYYLWEVVLLWLQFGFMVREALITYPITSPFNAWAVLWWTLREGMCWPHLLVRAYQGTLP